MIFLTAAGVLWAEPKFDLLLRNGHVIDPKNGLSAVRDVGIANRRITAIAASLPAADAKKVVDASGLFVTPGLIDIHTHIYVATGRRADDHQPHGVYPDSHSFRSGITTMVDAGTSGYLTFPDFKERIIDRSRTRVLAWLHITAQGRVDKFEQDAANMQPAPAAEMVKKHRDVIVGIKTAHYRGPEWVAVDRALEAARLAGVPVMVDFGTFRKERPYEDLVLKKLRPGDIYTHTYLPWVPMFDDQGRVRPYLFEARKRGVIFDAGHGGGSLVFRYLVPALQQGFAPDSISTDIHISSMLAGMKDILNVMSKFLNAGMPLDDVIRRSTWNPAREIRHTEIGHLSVGAPADVAVLRVERGEFGFIDVSGARMKGNQRLACELTIRDGAIVWDLNGLAAEDWKKKP
ncbi:MAG: amidohydrolase/deacetylase family metallohydrolase [Bryobacteraceae bacterium]